MTEPRQRPTCPTVSQPPAPRRNRLGRGAAIISGALFAAGIVAIVGFSAVSLTGFSAQDKHYLAVLHDPCAHSEVVDTTRCNSWGQDRWTWPDERTLVRDARDVCAAEHGARVDAKIPTGGSLIAERHPSFFDLQVGLEEVAARNVYCPKVIKPERDRASE